MVQLEKFFGPSYFVTALAVCRPLASYISFALVAIVISVIEQVKFLEMYPATKPWQSTFPQSADHISDVLRIRTHVLLMCFSCYAVTFLLYLLECALAYTSLGIDLLLLSTQVPSESEMLLQTVNMSKIIIIYVPIYIQKEQSRITNSNLCYYCKNKKNKKGQSYSK